MRFILLFILGLVFCGFTYSQTPDENMQLANQYYKNKEYEKANIIYEGLIKNNDMGRLIFANYINSLYSLQDYKQAIKTINQMSKQFPNTVIYEVELGNCYTLSGNSKSATNQFESIIKSLNNNRQRIIEVSEAFLRIKEYNYALKTLNYGKLLFKNDYSFNLQIGNVYYEMGNFKDMLREYIEILDITPMYIEEVQKYLQSTLQSENSELIKTTLFEVLLSKIQSVPNEYIYSEMLIWLSIQEQAFEQAFDQTRSLDRRLKENGNRLFSLASICVANEDYPTAEKCYSYIIGKGANNPYYFNAKYELLNIQYLQVISSDLDREKVLSLKSNYELFFEEFGKNSLSILQIKNYSHILAFYLDSISFAIKELEFAIHIPNSNYSHIGECKIELADIFLIDNDVWEAILLYSQVANDLQNDPIGHLAKFKKSKVFFYIGEFRWAQTELNVLKASTSKLISNDAMDLSIIITDNIGDDSSMVELSMYARGEFMLFKKKTDLALMTFDSIISIYPMHNIVDETIFKIAKIQELKGNYQKLDSLYLYLYTNYPYGIYADDAIYLRGVLNETILNNKDLAKSLYQDIIIKYPGSLFIVDSRKRFRNLRGDLIN